MSEENASEQSSQDDVKPIWAVSARIIEERAYGPGGRETKRGTHKFRANQKVYVQHVFSFNVQVIGRYRGKHNYISSIVRTTHLSDFCTELVYSPTIIERLQYGYIPKEERQLLTDEDIEQARIPRDGSIESKQKAEAIAEWFKVKLSRLLESQKRSDTESD